MKRILVNLLCAQPSIEAKYHGGGEYTKTIFEHLIKKYSKNIKICAFYDSERFLDEWLIKLSEKQGVIFYNVKGYMDINDLLKKEHFDVLYTGAIDHYPGIKFPHGLVRIGTLHGLREYEAPIDKTSSMYYDKIKDIIKCEIKNLIYDKYRTNKLQMYKRGLKQYDKVVCVSNHTYYSIATQICMHRNSLFLSYTPAKHYDGIMEIKDFPHSDYILLVSGNRWIKNCYRAILALDNLYSKGLLDKQTVLTGGISNRIRKKIQNPNRFTILKYVDSRELEYLYSNCVLFLYPTLNEGFGMPPLEAMRYGKTCVVSGICSIPEICGDAVYYCDPYRINEIEAHILMALEHPKDVEEVTSRFKKIQNRQIKDLDRICELIVK